MSKHALRSAICRNVRDGAYIPAGLRRGHEVVRELRPGLVTVFGAARPLESNVGALLAAALGGKGGK